MGARVGVSLVKLIMWKCGFKNIIVYIEWYCATGSAESGKYAPSLTHVLPIILHACVCVCVDVQSGIESKFLLQLFNPKLFEYIEADESLEFDTICLLKCILMSFVKFGSDVSHKTGTHTHTYSMCMYSVIFITPKTWPFFNRKNMGNKSQRVNFTLLRNFCSFYGFESFMFANAYYFATIVIYTWDLLMCSSALAFSLFSLFLKYLANTWIFICSCAFFKVAKLYLYPWLKITLFYHFLHFQFNT